jgi:hypothetical protein
MEVTLLSLLESDLPFLIEVRNDESTRSQLENDSLFTLEDCKEWFTKEQPKWLLIINHNLSRKGYARLAYQKYLENTDYADLWVFEDNHAKKLYEELGFVETGENGLRRGRKYLKMVYKK